MAASALWLVAGVLAASTTGCAQAPHNAPDSPVVDLANVLLPPQEIALEERLERYYAANCIAVVVASLPTLKGEPIERVANRLANDWGIGDARTNQGLLILVAPQERKVRIEVGTGLEQAVTNQTAADIIQTAMMPRYKQGDIAQGTLAGADAVMQRLDAGAGLDGLDRSSCKKSKGGAA